MDEDWRNIRNFDVTPGGRARGMWPRVKIHFVQT